MDYAGRSVVPLRGSRTWKTKRIGRILDKARSPRSRLGELACAVNCARSAIFRALLARYFIINVSRGTIHRLIARAISCSASHRSAV